MRTVTDERGRTWDVAIGRGSYGTALLMFSLRTENDNRTSLLASETVRDAERELASLSDEALRQHLADSRPWQG
ncbi:hypothetical protein [Longimicrobium sp.]|jgi:hypothetical protein|uniref:hypothetical protein n=1 Tax=Longimicrobium sp. TaxID=2029185 RepID=UPI002F940440